MKKLLKQSNMGSAAALLLLAIFAVCILSVLLTGADVFRSIAQRDQLSFDRRTAAQYLATRLQQADRPDSIAVAPFGDITALVCEEEIDGERYLTRVYVYGGYLCELFSHVDAPLLPEDGERIMAMDDLRFQLTDGLVTAAFTDSSGNNISVSVALRSGKGDAA